MVIDFTEDQIERYSRQIILPQVGGEGLTKIRQASVAVVGAGGLGSPVLLYLAAAGVGTIGVIDYDVVDLSNLSRQIIHTTADLGKDKTQSAAEKLKQLNPEVNVVEITQQVNSANVAEIIGDYDVVVDGSDNFASRFLINDACFFGHKPLIHGAILRFGGQVTTIVSGDGPCYRCVFVEPPPEGEIPNCQQAGVIGAIAGIVGSIQAAETIKVILKKDSILKGRMLIIDAMDMVFRQVSVKRDPNCHLCGKHPTITKLSDYRQICLSDRLEKGAK